MTHELADVDLGWLAQRCAAYFSNASRPARQKLAAWQQELAIGEAVGGALAQADATRSVIESLFAAMQLDTPAWQSAPVAASLPMIALIPGVGCRIVQAWTPEGYWLVEGPAGSQRLYQLPEGGSYAAISASRLPAGGATAFAMFKSVMLARKSVFFQAVLASFLASQLAMAASLYSMQVYDRVIPTQGIDTLIVLTVGVLLAAVLELVVKMARSSIFEASVKDMDLELSHRIFLRLVGIRMDQFPASVGTLSAQLRSYETIRAFAFAATLYVAVDAPFALFFLFVIVLIGGHVVAAVPAIFFVLSLLIGLFFRSRIAQHAEIGNAAANRKLGLLVETIEGAESIKSTGAGWQQMTRWDLLNREAAENEIQVRHFSEQAAFFAAFMQQSSYILLVAVGAWVASTSTDFTSGGLIACSILSGRVLGPVGALPGLIVQWAHARAALDSLEKVFALENDNHGVERPLVPERIRGDFRVEDLKFGYPGRQEALAVERLNIQPGEKVAILGAVGVGKTTLLRLLAGIYKPRRGQVLLDGLDIQQVSRAHLSEQLGYLPQEIKLLAGTLRENLLAGLAGVSEEDILAACRASGLAALVAAHPKGLDLPIAEGGTGVSGGQKQLVGLTRLLLAKPSVWLLDEPTAAMDEQTEARSLVALRQAIGEDQTLILVTHKPVLLNLVERLVILSPGGIFLDGPRDEVLEQLRRNAMQQAQQESAGKAVSALPQSDVTVDGGMA